jgi:hypothetical protein
MKFSERQRILKANRARQDALQWEMQSRRICEEKLLRIARREFGRIPLIEELENWRNSRAGAEAVEEVCREVNNDASLNFRFPNVRKAIASDWPTGTMWRGQRVK